jgi:hypothetical protein
MADELNIPTHRWYQKRNHIALAKEDFSRQFIYDSGIQKIDAWINSQPWGDVYIVNRLSPPLVLDFDETYYRTGGTATDLVSAATHARASAATYVDADGILQTADINEPRVGHHIWNGSAWVDEGYFHESEARTNLVTYSTITAVNYSVINATITDNAATDLGGTSTSARLTGSGATDTQRIGRNSITTGNSCFSWTIRKDSTHRYFQILQGSDGAFYQNFDLLSGVLGTAGGGVVNADVIDEGDFWRIFAVFNVVTSSENYLYLAPSASAAYGQSSSTSDYADLAFHQVEAGSTPSSYIPTSGSTVTRAADTLTIPSANLPWNPLAVSIQMAGTMTYADTGNATELFFLKWDESVNDRIQLYLDTATGGTGQVLFKQKKDANNDIVRSLLDTYSPGINVPFNISSRHGSTFINGAVDGTALTANTTPTALPDLSSTDMQIGSTFNGTIKLFRVWADDLTDEGIAEASSNV